MGEARRFHELASSRSDLTGYDQDHQATSTDRWKIESAAELLGTQAFDRSERLMPWSIARFVSFQLGFSSCDDRLSKLSLYLHWPSVWLGAIATCSIPTPLHKQVEFYGFSETPGLAAVGQ